MLAFTFEKKEKYHPTNYLVENEEYIVLLAEKSITGVSDLITYYLYDCRSRVCEFDPGQAHTFMEIDREILYTVILLI